MFRAHVQYTCYRYNITIYLMRYTHHMCTCLCLSHTTVVALQPPVPFRVCVSSSIPIRTLSVNLCLCLDLYPRLLVSPVKSRSMTSCPHIMRVHPCLISVSVSVSVCLCLSRHLLWPICLASSPHSQPMKSEPPTPTRAPLNNQLRNI